MLILTEDPPPQDKLQNVRGPVQNENVGPLSKKQELQDSDSRALNQAQCRALSMGPWVSAPAAC